MIDTIQLAGHHDKESLVQLGEFHPLPGPADIYQAATTLQWIEDALSASDADYLIVAGHYPVYSACTNGSSQHLIERLDPLLKMYGVSAYLSGHDHCQFHYIHDGMNYILTGTGHDCCYDALNKDSLPEGGELKYILADSDIYYHDSGVYGGFASFEVDDKEMKVKLHKEDGKVLYEVALLPRMPHMKRGHFNIAAERIN